MATTNTWLEDRKIILSTVEGNYTREDLLQNRDEIPQMIADSGSLQVQLLFDATAMTNIRFSPRESTQILTYLKADTIDHIAIAGVPRALRPFATLFASILASVIGVKMTFFTTKDEAIAWLQNPEPERLP